MIFRARIGKLIFCMSFGFIFFVFTKSSLSGTESGDSSDKFFGLTKLWTIHLKIAPEEWKKITPSQMQGFPGGPPAFDGAPSAGDERRPAESQGQERRPPGNPFQGNQFPYVSADFEINGTTITNIGVRYKGQASFFMSGGSDKKSFKIDFNRFVKEQKFYGLTKLNLNNNTADPSQMVDALSYETFREFQLPAPRTTFAKVYLTVDGKISRKYLGLYTVVEQIDGQFLKRNFDGTKGLLLKPKMVQGFPYFGKDWNNYERPYEPKSGDVKAAEAERFMAFTDLVNNATDTVFRQKIREYTDVDQFLRFLAVNVAIANYDSILGMGQNYYIYYELSQKKFLWIPWDLNLAFGKFMILEALAKL